MIDIKLDYVWKRDSEGVRYPEVYVTVTEQGQSIDDEDEVEYTRLRCIVDCNPIESILEQVASITATAVNQYISGYRIKTEGIEAQQLRIEMVKELSKGTEKWVKELSNGEPQIFIEK